MKYRLIGLVSLSMMKSEDVESVPMVLFVPEEIPIRATLRGWNEPIPLAPHGKVVWTLTPGTLIRIVGFLESAGLLDFQSNEMI